MIKQFTSPDMNNQNTYLISNNKEAILIDISKSVNEVLTYLEEQQFNLQAIIITHGHWDHIVGLPQLLNHYPDIKMYIHQWDEICLFNPTYNGSIRRNINLALPNKPKNLIVLSQSTTIKEIGYDIFIKHIPGHTPGSQYILINNLNAIFIGDTIFKDKIGFHSIPNCDDEYFKLSLQELVKLPSTLNVYPGHHDTYIFKDILITNQELINYLK